MLRVVAVLALASCYAPSPPAGAPCGAADVCPRGLSCVNGTCGGVTADASSDADASTDGLVDGLTDAGIPADWVDPAWKFRRDIQIDAAIASELADFPILVTLPPTFDYASARADGADVRFTTPGGMPVSSELDTWTVGGTSSLWVRAPKVGPATAMHHVWMYYGNPLPPDPPSSGVWSELSVHHLGDLTDATGTNHTATAVGATMPLQVAGRIGGARSFDGIDDRLTLTGTGYDFTTSLSVSVWFRATVFNQIYQAIVCKGDTTWRLQRDNATDHLAFDTTSGGINDHLSGATNANDGQWHHAAIVYDQVEKRLYVDGKLEAAKPYVQPIAVSGIAPTLAANFNARFFTGVIDEVRITSVARPTDWITAEYLTVIDPGFALVGAVESIP